MTWPGVIAAAILTAFALLVLLDQHKHRSTTEHTDPQDGEPRP